jgi:hypothetical protein
VSRIFAENFAGLELLLNLKLENRLRKTLLIDQAVGVVK